MCYVGVRPQEEFLHRSVVAHLLHRTELLKPKVFSILHLYFIISEINTTKLFTFKISKQIGLVNSILDLFIFYY